MRVVLASGAAALAAMIGLTLMPRSASAFTTAAKHPTSSPTATNTAVPHTPTRTSTPTATSPPSTAIPTAADAALPDLVAEITDWTFVGNATVSDGEVAEGCASNTSGINLIRFGARTKNIGTADLVIGDPMCPSPCSAFPGATCGNAEFICSPSVDHPRYVDSARYELLDAGGQTLIVGRKQGYCLRDDGCPNPKFTCTDQGLSVGCFDTYPSTFACQYLDVTGVAPGTYTLRVTVDPLNHFEELNEDNNATTAEVIIPDDTVTAAPTETPTASATVATSTLGVGSVTPTPPPATDTPTPTASPTLSSPACRGDCNGDGVVTITELVTMVNIAMWTTPADTCPAAGADAYGNVTITELISAVDNALDGCAGTTVAARAQFASTSS